MLRWGLALVAVLIPMQIGFGHFTGEYVRTHQRAKFAALEGRWNTEQPTAEVLIAIPGHTVLATLLLAFLLTFHYNVLARDNLEARPWGSVFPICGVPDLRRSRSFRCSLRPATTARRRAACDDCLVLSSCIRDAGSDVLAADNSVQRHGGRGGRTRCFAELFFYGGIIVLPVIAFYTAGNYWVFRGKVRAGYG